MKAHIHIGLPGCGSEVVQAAFDAKREHLKGKGFLYPASIGRKNHTRLYMAVTDPDRIEPFRWARGHETAEKQAKLRASVQSDLSREIEKSNPKQLIVSAPQFAMLHRDGELQALKALISEFCDDIDILAHVDEQARSLSRLYAAQILDGRIENLEQELELARSGKWSERARENWAEADATTHAFPEVHASAFWLDYGALVDRWGAVFGADKVHLLPYDETSFYGPELLPNISKWFNLPKNIGKFDAPKPPETPSAASLTRSRLMNEMFQFAFQSGRAVPRQLWKRALATVEIPGQPLQPGSLFEISGSFSDTNKALVKRYPEIKAVIAPDKKLADWQEAAPEQGFRATQYMAVFWPLIEKASRQAKRIEAAAKHAADEVVRKLREEPEGNPSLPPEVRASLPDLARGRFAPHNRLGNVVETAELPDFKRIKPRKLPKGSSGNVIVACMKNEAPYIVEWIAFHRAIGVDNFLIYTNDCSDGTSELLDRLQDMGVLQHRNNDKWKGNSPQQYALNQSLKEDLVKEAEWLIHIDVDEFINVRVGNGTLAEFHDMVPDATNVAMTWRLFGHSGIVDFRDEPVIGQFTKCAPKYCPKPHTVWGFKTMFRNTGAYGKMSCHRPNKLDETKREQVRWVNGSGRDMGDEVKDRGWRSDLKTIGYDLLQLNHYALRSGESYLIKRQRGRALHVDRSIGLSYWVRMDWSDSEDRSIQRNLPRLQAEMDELLADKKLKKLHDNGVKWHQAKAQELRENPEFSDLLGNALNIDLNALERVAYSLALDVDN